MGEPNPMAVEVEAQIGKRDIVNAVQAAFEAADIPTFSLERDGMGIGFRKPNYADLARRERYVNEKFKGLSLPVSDDRKGRVNGADKAVFTFRFGEGGWTVQEAVEHIINSEQFKEMVKNCLARRNISKKKARVLQTFNVYVVAKGWVAEQLVAQHDEWSKMWESHDLGGIDFRIGNDTDVQFRSLMFGRWNGDPNKDEKDNKVVYYCWINGQIHTAESYKTLMNRKADAYAVNWNEIETFEILNGFDF